MVPSDSTMVTGSPTAARTPRTGDVLGERWEIRATISSDGLYATYRGTDQETEDNVLVRVIGLGRLSERDAQRMAARLRMLIGMGGPVLSPIRDVDHEGARLFVIERFPDGASFRSVLETRRAKRQLFTPAELVPLVAHLSSALSAIGGSWFHGDVRAERIYVGPDRVLLTGGFALAVMSGDIVRETLAADGTLRGELAPEAAEGLPGAAADRWGVAALVWEALTGSRPEDVKTAPASLGELGPLLLRYLDRDASLRPASLEPLVAMLAARAKVPVPRVTPESFSADEPATDIDQTELALGPDPSLSSEAMALLASGANDTPSPSDTAKHVALDEDGAIAKAPKTAPAPKPKKGDLSDIDPALLAAAQASRSLSDSGTFNLEADELKALETQGKPKTTISSSELDPRLVRAALGVSMDDASMDEALEENANDTLPATAKAAAKAVAKAALPMPHRAPLPAKSPAKTPAKNLAKKPANTTQEIDASELEVVGQKVTREVVRPAKSAAVAPVSGSAAAPMSASPMSAGQANGAPRPASLDSAETFVGGKAVPAKPMVANQPEIARPQLGAAAAPAALLETPVVPQPLPARVSSVPPPAAPANNLAVSTDVAPKGPPGPGGPRLPANEAPTRVAGPPSISGNAIIAVAVAVALLILGSAFWYRHVQESTARDHRIDERLRELRHDSSTEP